MRRTTALLLICWSLVATPVLAGGQREPSSGSDDAAPPRVLAESAARANEYPQFLSFVDGLHVTGTPVEVDIATYRLRIMGLVATAASYTFDEIRSMPSEEIEMTLECPGTFVDEGTWTGVQLRELLAPLGIGPEATRVRFHSIDESYSLAIDIDDLAKDVLVAWAFNGEEFPVYHGYPLRVCVEGAAGAYWVKWLGRIEVE